MTHLIVETSNHYSTKMFYYHSKFIMRCHIQEVGKLLLRRVELRSSNLMARNIPSKNKHKKILHYIRAYEHKNPSRMRYRKVNSTTHILVFLFIYNICARRSPRLIYLLFFLLSVMFEHVMKRKFYLKNFLIQCTQFFPLLKLHAQNSENEDSHVHEKGSTFES